MLTTEQKKKYLEEDNKVWKKLCEDTGTEFIPHTENEICWEGVEERLNNHDERVEEVEYDEEELFKQLDEDLAEMERQGLLKRTRRS
jgi:hypothetical protein